MQWETSEDFFFRLAEFRKAETSFSESRNSPISWPSLTLAATESCWNRKPSIPFSWHFRSPTSWPSSVSSDRSTSAFSVSRFLRFSSIPILRLSWRVWAASGPDPSSGFSSPETGPAHPSAKRWLGFRRLLKTKQKKFFVNSIT